VFKEHSPCQESKPIEKENVMGMREEWTLKVRHILTSGRVPSKIIDELRHMQPNHELSYEPGYAIRQVIDKLECLDTEGWLLITRLINSAKFYRTDVRTELRARFSPSNKGCSPDATEARAAVLITLLNMKYRFYPIDLIEEIDIKNEMPDLWRTAWKRCGIEEHLPTV
jgi:hypothetical protein